MKVYHYHPDTTEYMGRTQAMPDPRREQLHQFDPANPEHYLVPAQATMTAPPEIPAGQVALWDGEAWALAPDFRGQTGYRITTGEPVEIKDLGPWPADLASSAKPGPAYEWDGQAWVYSLKLDPPSLDHTWDDTAGAWRRTRYSKKDFLLLCGLPQVVKLNAAIGAGNAMAKTVHDLLFAAEFIDLGDPATAQMVGLLTTAEAGQVLTPAQAQAILAGG